MKKLIITIGLLIALFIMYAKFDINYEKIVKYTTGINTSPVVYSVDNVDSNVVVQEVEQVASKYDVNIYSYINSKDAFTIYTTDLSLDVSFLVEEFNIDKAIDIKAFSSLSTDYIINGQFNIIYQGENTDEFLATLNEENGDYYIPYKDTFINVYDHYNNVGLIKDTYYIIFILLFVLLLIQLIEVNILKIKELGINKLVGNYKFSLNKIVILVIGTLIIFMINDLIGLLFILIDVIIISNFIITHKMDISSCLKERYSNRLLMRFIGILNIVLKLILFTVIVLVAFVLPKILGTNDLINSLSVYENYDLVYLEGIENKGDDYSKVVENRIIANDYFIQNHDAFYFYKLEDSCSYKQDCNNEILNNGYLTNSNYLKLQGIDIPDDGTYLIVDEELELSDQELLDQLATAIYGIDTTNINIIRKDLTINTYNSDYYSLVNPTLLVTNDTAISSDIALIAYQNLYYNNPNHDDQIYQEYYQYIDREYPGVYKQYNLLGQVQSELDLNLRHFSEMLVILVLLLIIIINFYSTILNIVMVQYRKEIAVKKLVGYENKEIFTTYLLKYFIIDFILLIISLLLAILLNITMQIILIMVLVYLLMLITLFILFKRFNKKMLYFLKGMHD